MVLSFYLSHKHFRITATRPKSNNINYITVYTIYNFVETCYNDTTVRKRRCFEQQLLFANFGAETKKMFRMLHFPKEIFAALDTEIILNVRSNF